VHNAVSQFFDSRLASHNSHLLQAACADSSLSARSEPLRGEGMASGRGDPLPFRPQSPFRGLACSAGRPEDPFGCRWSEKQNDAERAGRCL